MKLRLAICDLRWIGLLTVLAGGCITHPQNRAATQPSTAINLATTQPSYWLEQPDTAVVTSFDFDKLWHACEAVARDYLFKLDREDYRGGVLTTQPMISGQWFEPWRRDTSSFYDIQETSSATIRRSIRFEFTRDTESSWHVSPKVLVERESISEKRLTSVVLYRSLFTGPSKIGGAVGSREADEGLSLQREYWYPVRRDTTFERRIANDVERALKHS